MPALVALQKAEPSFGGLNATPLAQLGRIFVSPGPVYDPVGRGGDWGRAARALFAAGFRSGEVAVNTFSHHFTPAGSMMGEGALSLGGAVVPGGAGQTGMQVAAPSS